MLASISNNFSTAATLLATVLKDKAHFDNLIKVESKKKGIVLDCYADWCGPCRKLMPVLEKVCKDNGNVEFVKINVDQHSELAEVLGVTGVPAVFFAKGGKIVDKFVGALPETKLKEFIEKNNKKQ